MSAFVHVLRGLGNNVNSRLKYKHGAGVTGTEVSLKTANTVMVGVRNDTDKARQKHTR